MRAKILALATAGLVLPLASACQTDGSGQSVASASSGGGATTTTTGSGGAGGGGTTTSGGGGGGRTGGTGIPALVNVNLENVLNDLSVRVQVDRANIPVNAQIPIDVAANVCGVSVDVLAASAANGHASCTAKTATPELAQVVQQQVAAGGSVGGGAQGGSTATTGGATGTGGSSSSGSTGTGGTSSGTSEGTTHPPSPPPPPPPSSWR